MSGETNNTNLVLSDDERDEVLRILKEQVPQYAVWVFGSRVCGGAKPYSDLDIVIVTTVPLTFAQRADIEGAFDESDLVFKVDVVDWASTKESFRKIINDCKIVLQTGE